MLVLGLPIMLKEVANTDALAKNKLFEAAVKEVGSDKVTYAQPWTSGANPEKFEPYLPNAREQHGAGSRARRRALYLCRLRHGAGDDSIPRSSPA